MFHVGTSGFSYGEWKGIFYPEDLPQRQWLEYYSSQFDCVEINSSFYHLPRESVIKAWHDRVPQDFRFVMKGSPALVCHTCFFRPREKDQEIS